MEGLRGLTGHQVVGVLRERYAAEARAHAATLEAVWETVLCADADSAERLSDPDEWSTDEVRAALGLTRAAAHRLAGEAHQMFHRLPELGEAMAAGTVDPARARVIADWTTELSDAHAHQVAAEVLAHCRLDEQTRLTTGQLAEEIKVQAIALDPEWARRRYERSIADRKVLGSRTPDGTAKLSGTNLPLQRVAASVARLDGLAKSAKRAGDPRPIDHLRADLFLGMTDGTYRAGSTTTRSSRRSSPPEWTSLDQSRRQSRHQSRHCSRSRSRSPGSRQSLRRRGRGRTSRSG